MPAIDTVKLASNEGESYDKDLRLLFAASGDLRNAIKTMTALPKAYTGTVFVVLNDRDFDVVARNLIMLLTALAVPADQNKQAVECIIHLWFSASIRQQDIDLLTRYVRPLFEDVVIKVAGKSQQTILGKTWQLGGMTSCRAELSKLHWNLMLTYFSVPTGLTIDKAHEIRKAVTLAPERQDYVDRWIYAQVPARRVSQLKFRQDGILLPFGHARGDHTIPNPTFFQSAEWPLKDSADPVQAWSLPDILKVDVGPVSNDLYGKLYYYLKELLTTFRRRLLQQMFMFSIHSFSAIELPTRLQENAFARIEVSNVSDAEYLGVGPTIACFAPLLQTPSENPRATLITLFMNAVPCLVHAKQDREETRRATSRAAPYTKALIATPLTGMSDPRLFQLMSAVDLSRDMDYYFDEYKEALQFDTVQKKYHVQIKEPHTIIEKWPLRLKLGVDHSKAQEEFDVLSASEHVGHERYVEWKRVA